MKRAGRSRAALMMTAGAGLAGLGLASLALSAWLWFGDWPQQMKPLVEAQRAERANAERGADPLIATALLRDAQSLDGRWQAVIDPYDRAGLLSTAPLAQEPRTPSDLSEFSFENGLELEVPGDWNGQDPRLVYYIGPVWYKREFDAQPRADERQFLYFGAANYRARVYLNGLLLGVHSGGFTPFDFEVTDRLRSGRNLLVVQVDNRSGPEDVPTALTDWHNYGGLTRSVRLLALPKTFVREFELRLADASDARLEGWVQFDGPAAANRSVRIALPELGATVEAVTNAEGRAAIALDAAPRLWTPEQPTLYRVEIEAGDDRIGDSIGFRRIEARGSEILLNGAPIFLRGISLHEESLRSDRARGPQDARALLELARELGCNFVRLAHYPHDEHVARLADRLGLLVWAEIPVYWNVDFASARALAGAEQQLTELIARDRNRASIVFWSVGNETPRTPERLRFMQQLARRARELDGSRLVTAALLSDAPALADFMLTSYLPALAGFVRDEWPFLLDDPLAQALDVAAVNEYFGWYYCGGLAKLTPISAFHARRVMLDHMHRIRIDVGVDKPLILSEFGAGARLGRRAPEEQLAVFSEDYQALVYRRQIELMRAQPHLAGASPWVLKDFRSPLRMYQGVQDHFNRKGLVSEDGRPKLAFDVLRRFYLSIARSDPAPHAPQAISPPS